MNSSSITRIVASDARRRYLCQVHHLRSATQLERGWELALLFHAHILAGLILFFAIVLLVAHYYCDYYEDDHEYEGQGEGDDITTFSIISLFFKIILFFLALVLIHLLIPYTHLFLAIFSLHFGVIVAHYYDI